MVAYVAIIDYWAILNLFFFLGCGCRELIVCWLGCIGVHLGNSWGDQGRRTRCYEVIAF